MKTINYLLIPAIALLTVTSCKSKKAVTLAKQEGLIDIITPFDSKEYKSDEENFRSKQSGKSQI